MNARTFIIGAVIAAALQTVALGSILYDRISLLRSGREVVLQSALVDPRDLFRGHYVTLNLTAGVIEKDKVPVHGELAAREPVFVELVRGEDGFWVAAALHREYPADAADPVSRGPVIKGMVTSMPYEGSDVYRISFPFDRFFAPKSRAKELEAIRNDRKLGVIIALGDDGEGIIKGLSIDGERVYSEPLL